MKKSFFKRVMSSVCATAMLFGTVAGVTKPVSAAGATLGYWPEPLEISNEYYYQNQTLQPYGACFQIDELKNWSPDNDPDARYNRGAIELKERWMGPNVNPLASRDAKIMPLAMGNARASQAPSQGGDGDFVYAFNNYQYVDIYNFWGGSSGEGPIAIPSPELIDAGHRNGVPVTGTIFLPWGDGAYGTQFVSDMVEKDENGHFPAADKLVEIAQYYGFDGYIFNAESGTGVAGFKEFLAYIQEIKPDHFTITWYNGSGSVGTGSIKSWMQDGDTRITDEWWLDMSGGGYMDGSIQAAQATGVNPWNIHSTWEYWPMSENAKGGRYQTRLDENGMLKCSLGILAPTSSLTSATSSDDFINVWDQKLWVSPDLDPSSTYRPDSEFCGFSHLVADRTPVIGTDFVTNFTTGNGYKFYEDGQVVGKEDGWYNRSLTDVLPTWRWIIDSEGQKLNAKIDFDDAWQAGTSMKLYGAMDAGKSNHVKLYSSQLEITSESQFSMVYKAPKAGVSVELGLCFGETYDTENFKFYPLTTTADGQWNTSTIDLSEDAGKTAIAISLRLTSEEGVSDYALNVGQMAFTTHQTAPEATAKVTLDEVIYPSDKIMEARVYWEKAEDAFMYRIYRTFADGHKEFVGATPSDALYLGSLDRDGSESACTFEITSYSENGVKGGTQTFSIDWPAEVENGFVPVHDDGPNLALKRPAVANAASTDDGSVHLLVDGVIANSKWCTTATRGWAVIDLGENKTIQRWEVWHANCPGAGESPDMNTVDFDLQYAADDGHALLTGDDAASRAHVNSLSFTVADRVTNNKQDITDRNLAEPIQARYIKLNVTRSDNSAWHAIRIYEFKLYEEPGINNTASPYARNVTVKNNAGATDTVVVDNVIMKYSSGTYGDKNGTFHEDTGKVRLFTDLTSEEPIAVAKATQPNESYKQRGVGIAKFEGLELNPEGGRLFYDVLDGSGTEVTHSRRASIYYAPEAGAPSNEPASVTLARTTAGVQLRKQYATLTATGVEEGATLKIFASADAQSPILHTLPAGSDGVISQSRVPLEKDGGTIYYEVHKEGKPDSQRYAVAYGDPMELPADLAGLRELVGKCEAVNEADCVSATWTAFAEKLAAAKAIVETTARTAATAAQAEAARADLLKAYADLRYKGSTQRLGELCASFEPVYQESQYTKESFNVYQNALNAAKAAVAANDSSNYELEQLRIALEDAIRGLVVYSEVTITDVQVTPATASVPQGGTQQFTAKVTGTGSFSQAVKWSLAGSINEGTSLSETGLLTVAADEQVGATLTIWAVSLDDETKMANATVTVTEKSVDPTDPTDPTDPSEPGELDEETNVALNAEVIAYNGNNLGGEAGPEKLFDGAMSDPDTDKWCVDGKNMWVAFDIGVEKNLGKAILYHAGANNEYTPSPGAINTAAYEFYTLNTEKITVEELLAKTYEERTTLLADNSYWTLLASRTNNTEDITIDDLDASGARIFKINVSDTDSTNWGDCVRMYELELYAYKEVAKSELLTEDVSILGTGVAAVAGEEPEMAFDHDYSTKWCSEKTPNWIAFDVKDTAYADRLKVTHAGGGTEPEDERFNTNDFTLEVLNPEKYTDADFLALSQAEQATVMADDANWVVLKSYTGNEENVTDDPVESQIASRIYRLKVTDGDDNWWNGPDTIRIFEIELYGKKTTAPQPVEKVGITIDPTELTVNSNPGQKGQFTATVTGSDDVTVTWSISGNTSAETMIENGQLFLGMDETAKVMTVTATANADPSKSASATVYVEDVVHNITIYNMTNGTVTADPAQATKGTLVTLTVLPDEGYVLKEGSLKVNGAPIEGTTFTMPDEDVVITAEFELEPAEDLLAAARAAQKAAEEAQKKAEEAQKAAEAAQKAAEEAAASTAEDKAAAEAAKAAAEAAQAKAEAAQRAAEAAQTAAETAAQAAEASNLAAAQEAAKAAEEALKAAQEASNAARSAEAAAEAQRAAQAAQAKAEEAQAKAEEAQKAAEEAAASAAEDKTAAEAARVKAEEAQAQAEAAQAAAETAKTAAEAASAAAEQFQLAAAEEARKSAEEAAKSAASAAAAAQSAAQAAEAMVKAQAAQAAAEAAAKTAEEAQKKAEEAQTKAEEAAQSSAEDKEAAEKAAQEAKAAKEAAENAQKSAEEAKRAAQTAKEAAENANVEAAAAAALAAEYAQKVTETYNEIVKIKAEMVEFLAEAQKAAEQAEAERKAAEEARKKAEEAALQSGKYHALIVLSTYADKNDYAPTQQEALAAAIQVGKEAIDAAATLEEVEEALAAAKAAIDSIPTLAELMPFTDVKEDAWYYEAVLYAMQEGYFKGVTATTFAPESKLSRAMAVTVLYRMAGEPEVTGTVTFTDVKEDAYYYQALVWAVENGITTGMDDTRFAPNANVTREQMVTFLYRYAKTNGADVSKQADLSQYRDVKQVSEYAEEAMAWAVGSGILQGMEQNLLAPRGTATRAQAAAILMRYSELA